MFSKIKEINKKYNRVWQYYLTEVIDNPLETLIGNFMLPGGPAVINPSTEFYSFTNLELICEQAHITQDHLIEPLRVHLLRFKLRLYILLSIVLIIYFALAIIMAKLLDRYYFPLFYRIEPSALFTPEVLGLVIVTTLIMAVFLGIFIRIGGRMGHSLVDKSFADSICAVALLHLVVDLEGENALPPGRRRGLLRRINFLATMTGLLADTYITKDEAHKEWIRHHFKEIELYIQERKRWLVAPTDTTMDTLRQEFRNMIPIYLTGNFGDFEWRNLVKPMPPTPTLRIRDRIAAALPSFFGIILPLVLMGFYLWRPDLFPFITVSMDIVTFIFIAWLLLSIDAVFNLGVVAGLTSVAKGIKDLA